MEKAPVQAPVPKNHFMLFPLLCGREGGLISAGRLFLLNLFLFYFYFIKPPSGIFQRSNPALQSEELSASSSSRGMMLSLTRRLSVGSEMSLPHLTDALGSSLVAQQCAGAPFVTETKCFTRLEL